PNADDDYSILVIKVDDDEEKTNESQNDQINEEKQENNRTRNENLLLKQENKRIRSEILLLKQVISDNLLLKQINKRIRNDNFLLRCEINFLYQQIIQKDEIYKELHDKMYQAQLNSQNCIDNKKKIANQQKLIDNFQEKIEIVEISNSNKEKIIVKLIGIIRRINQLTENVNDDSLILKKVI
ncbi:35634_t:CDS:2, partial [Racocetra persica]